jgi:4-amino-4-deoxy-L-arabinose transferase-like glycosyltransferase
MEFSKEKDSRLTWIILALIALLLAIGLKVWLIMGELMPFNSDEAVVALMARQILQGERPIFFYGQAYMGSLDAFLVALGFGLFGQQVWVIRLVQSLLYLGVLITTLSLGKVAFGSWRVGILGMFFVAIPVVNVTLYTTVSLGGYGEALLIGNLALLIGIRLGRSIRESNLSGPYWLWGILGFLFGLGVSGDHANRMDTKSPR